MPRLDCVVETAVSRSSRARQLEATFDVPPAEKQRLEWHGEIPLDEHPWAVGLIVGPSGSGKSTIARKLFGAERALDWGSGAVVDAFDSALSMETISGACQAVGFNTIPAWLRPQSVLSTGEQFRVRAARLIAEAKSGETIMMDEFTSVVDRQVAQIGSHAIQKYVRKREGLRFVAVTCHYDVTDWLQPDWILEPATMRFQWRELQRRPRVEVDITAVSHEAWRLFAPYHYMSAELHRSAQCYGAFVGDRIAAFAGIVHRPHASAKNIKAVSRVVTLPDFQGLGLAFVLVETVAASYKALGWRFRNYPAHPSYVRAHDRSRLWTLKKKPGGFGGIIGRTSTMGSRWHHRPCAVFEYVGPAASEADAVRLLGPTARAA